ncbi:MAG TPA: Crp/Fnr family transcriptional regulator [Clostridiales bacterium]|nr:Crp/Fnr family transcriptional regulator [Clostridiales bacterium]
MIKQECIDFLKSYLPFLKKMSFDDRQDFFNKAVLRNYATGEIISNNETCSGMIIVFKGQVRAFIGSKNGKQISIYRLLEGDVCVLSASCVMNNLTFDVTIETEKDSQIIVLPSEHFERFVKNNTFIKDYVLAIMSQRLSDALFLIEQTLFSSFDKRLADFILEQANIDGANVVKITQDTIANHLGTAREVVTRMMNYFENEGYIELFRGGYKIINDKALADIANL